MKSVRAALEMVNQCRKLPVLLETFLGVCFTNFQIPRVF